MTSPTLRSILAATDFSAASDEVVRSAAALAAATGAELHLLNAFDVDQLPDHQPGEPAASYPDRVRQANDLLAAQAQRTAGGVRPASLHVVNYAPDKAILARASDVGAEIIVLGPHRGGGVGAHVLGTTADQVIRGAQVPCLVVRGPLSVPVRRIGVPTDFSENASAAIDVALVLSAKAGGDGPEISVFHGGWTVEKADHPGIERDELVPQLQRQIEDAVERLGGSAGVRVQAGVVWGVSPAETIAEHARRAGFDLLVMGTVGRSGMKRLLAGSVAMGVARTAHCPVLLVPPALAEHILNEHRPR
jgi:nucleotide-binding universal stress UspA family protein